MQDYPEALVVHLKRFRAAQLQRRRRRQPQKIERRVAFDTRWSPTDSASYDLTGVVIHHGSTTRGGHYTAYARSQNKWALCGNTSETAADALAVSREQHLTKTTLEV